MTDVQQIRRDILSYIRDHPDVTKWDVLGEVCSDCQKTGFLILRDLVDEGLIQKRIIHVEVEDAPIRIVRVVLSLTPLGRSSMEVME